MRIAKTVVLLWLAACSRASEAPSYAEEAAPAPAAMPPPMEPAAAAPAGGMARGMAAADALVAGDDRKSDEGGMARPEAQTPAPARMVHYHGFVKLKATTPAHTLQKATELNEAAGGYVELLTETQVVLRVPVAKFREVYASVAGLGEVLERSMGAQDVTDAFLATDLRVRTLRASRERLIALLAKADGAEEKLRLLSEIKRLTEQIDQLEAQLGTLTALAEFSRLAVEVVPFQVNISSGVEEPIAAYRWIHRLSPFRRDVALESKRFDLDAPTGFVELEDQEHWMAESADGAVIWTSTRDNLPAGTTAFWVEAIRARLGPQYASAEVRDVGTFKELMLVDQSERAYRYLVAVRVDGDELQVVEIYYPSAEQEKRYQDALRVLMEGLKT